MSILYCIDNRGLCQYNSCMKLDEVLNILSPAEACEIAGCGKSAYWHWYKKDIRRKVPDMAVLVKWSNHLKLSDADLGELIRDSYNVRIQIMEQLAVEDKRRIKPRSVLRRDLKAEITNQKKSEPDLSGIQEATKKKEELEEKHFEEVRLQEKLTRYKEKLSNLGRS